MNTFIAICSGIAAIYVLIEFGTVIYILANRRTAIPRIRASLRNLLGLDSDRTTYYNLLNDILGQDQNNGRMVREINERIANATVDNSTFKDEVANGVVGKLMQLRNKKVGGKVRQLTNRR